MKSGKWTRIFCLFLCLAVLAPCAAAYGEKETTKVSAYLLRLRESPSLKADVLDAYPRGTTVTILKKGDSWTKVRVHGKVGYMKTSLLAYSKKTSDTKKTESGKTAAKSASGTGSGTSSSESGTVMYVIRGTRLNLREEASSSSAILGSYRGGTKVTVLRKGRFWSRVEVKGKQGYMANDYLTSEY